MFSKIIIFYPKSPDFSHNIIMLLIIQTNLIQKKKERTKEEEKISRIKSQSKKKLWDL